MDKDGYRNPPSSLEELNLSGIFQTLPLNILEEILKALPNLKYLYVTVASHPKETHALQDTYRRFLEKLKFLGQRVLYVGEESPAENSQYQRIFLNLTGIPDEKIIFTLLNLSLSVLIQIPSIPDIISILHK